MSTKVYEEKEDIVIIQTDLVVVKIPLNSFSYAVSDTEGNVTFTNNLTAQTYKDLIPNIQDKSGLEVGGTNRVRFYLNLITGGYTPVALQANSLVTQAVVSTAGGAVILFENVVTENQISIDPITGVITFALTKVHSALIGLNLDRISGTPIVEIWVECFIGGVWVNLPHSARLKEYNNTSEFNVLVEIPLAIDTSIATMYRVKIRQSVTNAQLLATTIQNGTSVPSATISIYG